MSSKKERVIETASRLFFTNGITATSMDQIAEAVPVSKMTLYNYFQSKDRLLELVLERYLKKAEELIRTVFEQAEDPWQAMLQMNRERKVADMSELFLKELMTGYPGLSARVVRFQREFLGAEMEKMVFRCQQEGMIRKDLSPHVILLLILALKEYFTKPEVWKNVSDMHALGDQMMTILFHGMMTEEHKAKLKGQGS